MKSSNHEFEMYVLVGSKPIKEYFHEQSTFVEGRDGSEYTVRLRNSTSGRACFILSVDGLSVLDGQDCADNSPGYVLGAGESLDVICYKVDDGTGAKFVFGNKDDSYAAQAGKGTDNVGVIAARVFREKQRATFSVDPGWSFPEPRRYPTRHPDRYKKILGSGGPAFHKYGALGSGGFLSSNSIRAASSSSSTDHDRGISASWNVNNSSTNMAGEQYTSGGSVTPDMADMEQSKLGTVFGDAVAWKTEKVQFERASVLPDASLVIYYDTKKNLERRGIKFRKETAALPNPFPGNPSGCPTPPGWRK